MITLNRLPVKSTLTNILTNIRPEGELLLRIASTHLDTTTIEQIHTLLQQELDWEYLLQMAEKHRLIQLLYRNLNATHPQLVPKNVLNDLRGRFFANARYNLVVTDEILKVLRLFQDNNIRVIPYKGIVLASSVYGKLSMRQVYDIDVLVHEQDFKRSQEMLIAAGYQSKEKFDREHSFENPESNIEVDLHCGLTPFYFPLTLDFDSLWNRVEAQVIGETTIVGFSPEDLLLILCIQVAKDCWERKQHIDKLAKVCDIAELIRARSMLNWEKVMEQARKSAAERMLSFGLLLATELLGATLPEEILLKIQADSVAKYLVQQVSAPLFKEADKFSPEKNSLFDIKLRVRQLIFYLRMRERREDRVQYVLEIIRTVFKI